MSPAPRKPSAGRFRRPPVLTGAQAHRDWLSLIETSGPFLSMPVLRQTWPDLGALDKSTRERLRREHADWQADPANATAAWIHYVLEGLLGWAELLIEEQKELDALTIEVPEYQTSLTPSFILRSPSSDTPRLLGLICPPTQSPEARYPGETWPATAVDRLAHLCHHHDVPLGLVTNGRQWTLVYAPRNATRATATFDAIGWPEQGERIVVRAFVSLLERTRFFGVKDEETLAALFERSKDQGEELTEALGVQVRQAVELLVAAMGRVDLRERFLGRDGLKDVSAHDVYHGATAIMMRIVFLLFAEERRLLPSDNDLYLRAYSAGQLRAELQQRADDGSEEELEYSTSGWQRLLALFTAVYEGIEHPRLNMPSHHGFLFDPKKYAWLPDNIDDRTVLHMLNSVQRVHVGTGASKEIRTVSFRALDVEQIGYVYEGLLSFEGFRAEDTVVGLIGRQGLEAEVLLNDLEALAADHTDVASLAEVLTTKYKSSGIGTVKAVTKALTPLTEVEAQEARKKLLAVTAGDYQISERLLPFYKLTRTDLRDLPVVVQSGALYVTESSLRSSTGTHYTPQDLAKEVVTHTLKPLLYEPGPLQTADESQWVPKKAEEILDLKVADIAMGSGAFLVAATRYLADHLIGAWQRQKYEIVADYRGAAAGVSDAEVDPVVVEARRQIIEKCIYGVDINEMAVEMAKLSLWLVSMDAGRSFAFVDDRLRAGDALLGLTSVEQLENLHIEPVRGRLLHGETLDTWGASLRPAIERAACLRKAVATAPETSNDKSILTKSQLTAQADLATGVVNLGADLVVGVALAQNYRHTHNDISKANNEITNKDGNKIDGLFAHAAMLAHRVAQGEQSEGKTSKTWLKALEQRDYWLAMDNPLSATRDPLHWPTSFPEVYEQGGFDAVIGNPPFLGGTKITGRLGPAYRDALINIVAQGARAGGRCDLVAYFLLRAVELTNQKGCLGIIATNSLAQGDTREIGLDRIVAKGIHIYRAIKSEKWPSRSAVLEFCVAWMSKRSVSDNSRITLDGRSVSLITSSLDPGRSGSGQRPHSLARRECSSFEGVKIAGLGFTLTPDEARLLLGDDERNNEVLFPYLNGQDVNGKANVSASRWVINFRDWSLVQAKGYPAPFAIIEARVKPERQRRSPNGQYVLRKPLPERYWQYGEKRLALYREIADLKRVIVVARVSKTVMPVLVPTGQVLSEALVVFASEDHALLALLSSAPHYWWAITRASTLETRVRYTPSDVFETLALPELTGELRELGGRLDSKRRAVMLERNLGLTKLYNEVFDSSKSDSDFIVLREIHRLIDEAAVRAYGWHDLLEQGLDHGFHMASREPRYTIGPAVQAEILDRLLELNRQRYAEEVAAGLHDKGKERAKKKAAAQDLGMPEEGQLL